MANGQWYGAPDPARWLGPGSGLAPQGVFYVQRRFALTTSQSSHVQGIGGPAPGAFQERLRHSLNLSCFFAAHQ